MTILSIVCTKLLRSNAHLVRRVADHDLKVYIHGSRNGIAIRDSDKILICLRNALLFIGSPICQKGRSFFLKTNLLFYLEIMEEIASRINDSQWKIGAFLKNSFANKIKFRSRKKKINFGLNQQPDCAVILNADRKSSGILEAGRSQIPIASLVDSPISPKRFIYHIPANAPILLVYLFRHSIIKMEILFRSRIPAIRVETPKIKLRSFTLSTGSAGLKAAYYSTSDSSPKGKKKNVRFFFLIPGVVVVATFIGTGFYFGFGSGGAELFMDALAQWFPLLLQYLYEVLKGDRERSATLGGIEKESPARSAEKTSPAGSLVHMMLPDSQQKDFDSRPSVNTEFGAGQNPNSISLDEMNESNENYSNETNELFLAVRPYLPRVTVPEEIVNTVDPQQRRVETDVTTIAAPQPQGETLPSSSSATTTGLPKPQGETLPSSSSGPLLDPADEAEPSKRKKRISISTEEMNESNERYKLALQGYADKKERKNRDNVYLEICGMYPNNNGQDARVAVSKGIEDIDFWGIKMGSYLELFAPMKTPGEDGSSPAFTRWIEEIMQSRGKDNYSLKDLIDLKFDLEDPQKRLEILKRYFEQYKMNRHSERYPKKKRP